MKTSRILGLCAMAALAIAAICTAGPPIVAAAHTLSHPELRQSADGMRGASAASQDQAIQAQAPAAVQLATIASERDLRQPVDHRRSVAADLVAHAYPALALAGVFGDQPLPYPRT